MSAQAPAELVTQRSMAAAWTRALLLVLLLNGLFAVTAVATAMLPREPFRERVRTGFANGDLVQRDWIRYDSRRGSHQYDECLILQMLTNEQTPFAGAIGPVKYLRTMEGSAYCETLHDLVVAGVDPATFFAFPYTRYWHGYLPITAAFLSVTELRVSRIVLHALSYASLLLLLVVSWRSHGLLRVIGVSFAITGAAFWALPYFGQLFAHAPGDILVVLGTAALVAFRGALLRSGRIILFGAAFGALVVYLEFLTGQLPTGASLLFVAAYAVAAQNSRPAMESWKFASAALLAFGAGAALTVVLKQGLALAAVGPEPFAAFSGNLQLYMGSPPAEGALPSVLQPFAALYRRAHTLTYGSRKLAVLLLTASCGAWIFAAVVAVWRRRSAGPSRRLFSDVPALAVGAFGTVCWVLLLQTHTLYHARFMVRIVVVPVALGFAAAVWAMMNLRQRPPTSR